MTSILYCPNVDQFNVRMLLDLIYLTPMDVGIDFNSSRRTERPRRVKTGTVVIAAPLNFSRAAQLQNRER
ncbi:MAG TPA: hypothetical protein VGJ48_08370 [Pyrinomonadaceae bacterium]